MSRTFTLPSLLFAALLIATASPADAVRPDDGQDLLAQARDRLKEGDTDGAHFLLKKAVAFDPKNGLVRLELGKIKLHLGEYIAAEKDFLLAKANKVPAATVNPLLATALLAEGKFKQVVEMPPCPADPVCGGEILARHVQARLGLGDTAGAEADSTAALALNPKSIAVRVMAATVARSVKKDSATANRIVDAVLTEEPDPQALVLKGLLQEEAGKPDDAIALYRQSLALRPQDLSARAQLIGTLIALDRDKEADAEVDRLIEQSSGAAEGIDISGDDQDAKDKALARAIAIAPKRVLGLYLKSMLLVRAGKMPEALDAIRPVELIVSETIPDSKFLFALIHVGNNNNEQALQYAGSFRTTHPDSLIATKMMARIYGKIGGYGKVVETLAPVRNRLNDDAEILKLLGAAYLAVGDFPASNQAFADALRIEPSDPLLSAGQAVSLTRQEVTREQGLHRLEELGRSNPENAQIDFFLVSSIFAQGDYNRAISVATDMAKRRPNAAEPLVLRGAARQAMGDEVGAKSDFQAAIAKDPDFTPAALFAAELLLREGRADAARQQLDAALTRQPDDLPLLMERANVERRTGQWDAATAVLKTAILRQPRAIQPKAALLEVHATTGNTAQALAVGREMVGMAPTDPSVVDLVATTAIRLGSPEDGIAYYEKLLAARPSDAAVSFRYGQVLAEMGRLQDASRLLNRAVADDPTLIAAWGTLTAVTFKLKGEQAALDIASKALAHNLRNETLGVLPSDVATWAGRLTEAEKGYRAAYAGKPGTISVQRLFQCLIAQNKPAEAIQIMQDWLLRTPGDLSSRMELAQEKMQGGDLAGAAEQYRAILATAPQDAIATNNLAWIYDQTDDPRALETAKRGYHLAAHRPEAIDTYASILYRKGDRKLGAELMAMAYRSNPNDPQVSFHFARILVDSGKPAEARTVLKPLVERNVDFPEAKDARALYTRLAQP